MAKKTPPATAPKSSSNPPPSDAPPTTESPPSDAPPSDAPPTTETQSSDAPPTTETPPSDAPPTTETQSSDAPPSDPLLSDPLLSDPPPPDIDWCYPVLSPIKFKGKVIKPPAWIQLTKEEAAPLLRDGVIGADAAYPPDRDDT